MRWPTGHTRCPQEVLDIDKVAAATSPGICAPGPPKHGPAWSEARDRPRGSRAEALRNERGGLDSGPVLRLPGSHCPVCEGGLPPSQQLLNPPPVSHWEPKDPLECRAHRPSLGRKPSLAAHPAGRICSCGPLTPPPGHQGLSALESPPASRPTSGPPKELPSLLRRFLPVRWSQPHCHLKTPERPPPAVQFWRHVGKPAQDPLLLWEAHVLTASVSGGHSSESGPGHTAPSH